MKGQILGFDGATGAINAEDGARYSFTLADWKGDRPPQPRDSVDFVAQGGAATQVYLVSGSLGASLGGLGENAPDLTNAKAFVATRPQVIVEAIALLASVAFSFATSMLAGVAAVGFPGMMSQMSSQFSQVSQFGATMGRAGPSTGWLTFMSIVAYVLILIPIGAAGAIFLDATGKRHRTLELALGILCVVSALIYFLNVQAFGSVMTAMAGPFGAMASNAISFGFGGYVLVICGILLILTATNRITKTPGL